MSKVDYGIIEETAKELYIRALCDLPPDVRRALKKAYERETKPNAKEVFKAMLKAVDIADQKKTLVCQDTGLPIYMVKLGSLFHWDGAEIKDRLSVGARRATQEFPFRGSSTHPVTRVNPQTSVGRHLPVLYIDFIKNVEYMEILMIPKGSGSENMSTMKMFIPADGVKAVKKFILDTFIASGANPCPPGIIGVGLGGTADLVMRLAKEAIARPGLGGDVSTLGVHIEMAYTHITQNPVAVNTQCWPARRARARIYPDGRIEYGY
jgi:fumarate hydratase subunit alpha